MKSETVNNNVAEKRQQSGLTQEDLAEAVKVSRQTIISIEKGNYAPSVLLALKLAKVFGTKVEDIFSIKK